MKDPVDRTFSSKIWVEIYSRKIGWVGALLKWEGWIKWGLVGGCLRWELTNIWQGEQVIRLIIYISCLHIFMFQMNWDLQNANAELNQVLVQEICTGRMQVILIIYFFLKAFVSQYEGAWKLRSKKHILPFTEGPVTDSILKFLRNIYLL